MQFVDEAVIEVSAGDGGAGIVSFRREAHVPLGGPDGGDGGRGGDVIVRADPGVVTLLDHRYRRHYRAPAGEKGGAKRMAGRNGEPIVIPVPIGTLVIDETTGALIVDLSDEGAEVVVAAGGRGGQGNARFANSTRQTPRFAQDGTPGETVTLRLNLKLVADVGLVGLPNAGKSTWLRSATNSRARVGAYPFTTLVPNLGVYRLGDRDVVMADIPGLIEGAHEGHGLGDRFLKHIARTRVLIHIISLSPDAIDPLEAYRVVNEALTEFGAGLEALPQIVVLNKIDLIEEEEELDLWREEFRLKGITVRTASGLTNTGVGDVVREAAELLVDLPSEGPAPSGGWSPI